MFLLFCSLQLLPTVCIGVVFGMIFFGTLFLLISVISSGRTSKQIFNTSKKNICGRVLSVFVSSSIPLRPPGGAVPPIRRLC